MVDKPTDEWVPPSKVYNIITEVAPSWDVDSVEPIEKGLNTTFRIEIESPGTDEFCIFKTSEDGHGKIMAEYRLHRLIADQTSIPVPEVYFGFDDHPNFPTPFFIMEGVHGEHLQRYPRKPSIETEQSIARMLGRYIGQLQEIDVFSEFGNIRKTASGCSEVADLGSDNRYGLGVESGYLTWSPYLQEMALDLVDSVSETRFEDLTPEMERAINSEVDVMDDDFRPVIGRIDHYYENILVNEDHDSIRSLIDWDLAMTVEPEYDVACAEVALCGPLDLEHERRRTIRTALQQGYETARSRSVDWSQRHRWLYLLVQHSVRLLWDPLEVVVSEDETMEEKCRNHTEDLLSAIANSSSHGV